MCSSSRERCAVQVRTPMASKNSGSRFTGGENPRECVWWQVSQASCGRAIRGSVPIWLRGRWHSCSASAAGHRYRGRAICCAEHGIVIHAYSHCAQCLEQRSHLVGRGSGRRFNHCRWGVHGASHPGTYTVKATSESDPMASGKAPVPVVIPVVHIPGYDVGVDYHAYGVNFGQTAFLTIYNQPQVRQTVRTQLQGMADRGATFMHTSIWFVTTPGTSNLGETWRATFPITDQEAANLRAYAQDVAAVKGAGGNRLRLDVALMWIGASDYTIGSPTTGLGYTPIPAAQIHLQY
jgi:hypothetical protein